MTDFQESRRRRGISLCAENTQREIPRFARNGTLNEVFTQTVKPRPSVSHLVRYGVFVESSKANTIFTLFPFFSLIGSILPGAFRYKPMGAPEAGSEWPS